jgi:hypothetical protein
MHLAEVIYVQKDLQTHRFEANFKELSEIRTSLSPIRNKNVARGALVCFLSQHQEG